MENEDAVFIIDEIMKEVDKNKDNLISYEELSDAITEYLK